MKKDEMMYRVTEFTQKDLDVLESALKPNKENPVDEFKEKDFIKGFMERICNLDNSTNVYKIKTIINEMRVLNFLDYNEYMYLQNVCDSTIKYLASIKK